MGPIEKGGAQVRQLVVLLSVPEMMLIVLPNIGSVFNGDGLGGVPDCAILFLYPYFGRNHTTYGRVRAFIIPRFR